MNTFQGPPIKIPDPEKTRTETKNYYMIVSMNKNNEISSIQTFEKEDDYKNAMNVGNSNDKMIK